MRPVDYVYTPSRWGEIYHALPHDEALGGGSAGPGKSLVLLWDPFIQVMEEYNRQNNPNHPHPVKAGYSEGWCLHLRRESVMLDQTIQRSKRYFPQVCSKDATWYETDKKWVFSSGYTYQFGHCKDPDDWQKYQSNQYTYIAFDELTQFDEEQYFQIYSRLRSSDPVLSKMLRCRSMSNPQQSRPSNASYIQRGNPNWVRDYFVKPAKEGNVTLVRTIEMNDGSIEEVTRIFRPALLKDNPDPAFRRQYELRLQSLKPHQRQALLYGDWWYTVGSFFGDEWRQDLHIIKRFNIPHHWKTFRSMDWGYKKPGCILWFALDEDENMICFYEYTFQGKTDEQVAEAVQIIEKKLGLWDDSFGSKIIGVADTQLWERRGDSTISKAETFQRCGIRWLPASKNSKTEGNRQRNAELLSKRLEDHGGGSKFPGIVFFQNCERCIETIPSIQTDPNNSEVPLDGGEDHWLDAVLYACAYASRPTAVQRPRDEDADDEVWMGQAKYKKKGYSERRYGYGY